MKTYTSLFVTLISIVFLSSCSIKEDRHACPCWMTIRLPSVSDLNLSKAELRLRGNSSEDAMDYEFQEDYHVTLSESESAQEYEVPRGSVGVTAFSVVGEQLLTISDKAIEIEPGYQMDSLYGYFQMFHTRAESVNCAVQLHKEFCTVTLTIGSEDYNMPYDVEIRGNVSGLSSFDLLPQEGDFYYRPACINGKYIFRIPRQFDESLIVLLKDNDETVDSFPLGTYIRKSGYDWAAASLADVEVGINIPQQQVSISISDWDGIILMDVVI